MRYRSRLCWALSIHLILGCSESSPTTQDASDDTIASGATTGVNNTGGQVSTKVDSGSLGDNNSGGTATPMNTDASSSPDEMDAATLDKSTLSAQHAGDVGMSADPNVIWFEDFEASSTDDVAARYDQVQGQDRWTLVTDTPNGSGSALALRAGQGQDAVDMYKQLPDADEWFVRWYANYEASIPWHHSGMWFGGYNPAMQWPSPMAGMRPQGDDRFSISIEPVYDVGTATPRFDFYNYWMTMHSWMADPIVDDGTAYYGNGFVHRNDFTIDPGTWNCLEIHVRLNSDANSGSGAILEVWKNDTLMERFDDNGPMGYWIRDKFCPAGADGSECTDYPDTADQMLDLQMRNTTDLRLNAFWPQNYITDDAMGTLILDQMVVATQRIGCMQ